MVYRGINVSGMSQCRKLNSFFFMRKTGEVTRDLIYKKQSAMLVHHTVTTQRKIINNQDSGWPHKKYPKTHSILNSLLSVQKCDIRKISPTKTIDQSQLRNAALRQLHFQGLFQWFFLCRFSIIIHNSKLILLFPPRGGRVFWNMGGSLLSQANTPTCISKISWVVHLHKQTSLQYLQCLICL